MDIESDGEAPIKPLDVEELDIDYQVAYHLEMALFKMDETRSKVGRAHPVGRHCSIAITDLEKVFAYWDYFITKSDAAAMEPVLEDGWQEKK